MNCSDAVRRRETAYPTWPVFSAEEIDAATSVLRSGRVNYWTGEEGRNFEREFATSVGRKHGIALANGTVALELALKTLGVGMGDEVVVPARTFIATASAAVMNGARPVVADVDPDTQNLTRATVSAVLSPRTRAIIAVHLAGWPCDMPSIMALARDAGIRVVEDCAQATGAAYDGQPVGSFGDAAAFSFCQDKIITTGGEGGLLVLDDDDAAKAAWSFKDHGKCFDAVFNRAHPPGFRWVHETFGTNWRMTEVQAAMGRVALRQLPARVERRRRSAEILRRHLASCTALRLPEPNPAVFHSYYRFYAFVRRGRLRPDWTRDRIISAVTEAGIPCSIGSCAEIYLEKAFDGIRPSERLPVARELGETAIALLVHPTLTDADMAETGEIVRAVVEDASLG